MFSEKTSRWFDEKLKYSLSSRKTFFIRLRSKDKIGYIFNITLMSALSFLLSIFLLKIKSTSIAEIDITISALVFLITILIGITISVEYTNNMLIGFRSIIQYPVTRKWYYTYTILYHLRSEKILIVIVPLLLLNFKLRTFGLKVAVVAAFLYSIYVIFLFILLSSISIIFYKNAGKIISLVFYASVILLPIQNKMAKGSSNIKDYAIFNVPVLSWVAKGVQSLSLIHI